MVYQIPMFLVLYVVLINKIPLGMYHIRMDHPNSKFMSISKMQGHETLSPNQQLNIRIHTK